MVDNFELIKEYMAKQALDWEEGDCYYVQLLRRQADDPLKNGVKDPKYHGNMHSRSIKDYLIKNIDHLDKVKDDIKMLCDMFNVRAYIRLNKRNYKHIALEMMMHIAEQCKSGETFSSPFHLVTSACGTVCQAGKDKTWIVDMDKEYLPYENEVMEMILDCQPYDKKIQWYVDTLHYSVEKARESVKSEFFVVPTKSGKHFIVSPFNKQMFGVAWEKFTKEKNLDLKQMDIHKDNPTILYVPDPQ